MKKLLALLPMAIAACTVYVSAPVEINPKTGQNAAPAVETNTAKSLAQMPMPSSTIEATTESTPDVTPTPELRYFVTISNLPIALSDAQWVSTENVCFQFSYRDPDTQKPAFGYHITLYANASCSDGTRPPINWRILPPGLDGFTLQGKIENQIDACFLPSTPTGSVFVEVESDGATDSARIDIKYEGNVPWFRVIHADQ
jgi:hypothetical protein